jgi:hypothetical protein
VEQIKKIKRKKERKYIYVRETEKIWGKIKIKWTPRFSKMH